MAFGQFNQTIQGGRKTDGTYVNGVWQPGAVEPLEIATSVQPSSDTELKRLPEGRRNDGAYSLRSRQEIVNGDVFNIYGAAYEVLEREVWQNGVIPHYLGIAVRVQP